MQKVNTFPVSIASNLAVSLSFAIYILMEVSVCEGAPPSHWEVPRAGCSLVIYLCNCSFQLQIFVPFHLLIDSNFNFLYFSPLFI